MFKGGIMGKRDDLELARSYTKQWLERLNGGRLTENEWVELLNDMDRAKKLIDGVLKEDPNNVEAKAELARWHLCKAKEEGRLKYGERKAISHMEEVVRLIPESANYKCALGLLYAQAGRKKSAIEQLEKAVELEPNNIEFRKELDRVRSQSKGCFIASAVYGSPISKEVNMLRCFRDEILLKSFLGRFFVSTYYLLSPPIAKIVASSDFLRSIVRSILINPLLKLAKRNLANK